MLFSGLTTESNPTSSLNKYEFGFEFSFEELKNYISNHSLRLQCALSLGKSQYFLAPYWADQQEKTDFHQPINFWEINLLTE